MTVPPVSSLTRIRTTILAAWVFFGAMVAAGDETAPVTTPSDGTAVAIRVGDTPIFRAELDAAVRRITQGRTLDAAGRERLTAQTVEQLVDERLLRREIETRQISVDEDDVTEIVTRMRGQLADRNVPIETFLANTGRDEASLRNQIRLELALNKLLLPQLTPTALDAAYAKYRRELDGTLVRASHVVFRPDPGRGEAALSELERRAAAVRTAVLRGDLTFAEAARRHSAGPSRRQGGDLGFFPRHGAMDEEFARRAFSLAKGEISQPFATAFGVHLVLVTEVKPGGVGPDQVRSQLEKFVIRDAIREIVTRGRRDTPIEYATAVPHFASDTDRDDPGRRVVVTQPAAPVDPER